MCDSLAGEWLQCLAHASRRVSCYCLIRFLSTIGPLSKETEESWSRIATGPKRPLIHCPIDTRQYMHARTSGWSL